MPTYNTNRQNGVRGASVTQRSRHVSRFLNARMTGRVNGRDAVLTGVICKQIGHEVVVSVGYYPNHADEMRAVAEAAEILKLLSESGYTVRLSPYAPHRMWVTAHPRWS